MKNHVHKTIGKTAFQKIAVKLAMLQLSILVNVL